MFLDMQSEERKNIGEFEKDMNLHQARICNMDVNLFSNQEKETYVKVKR